MATHYVHVAVSREELEELKRLAARLCIPMAAMLAPAVKQVLGSTPRSSPAPRRQAAR